VGGDAAEWGAVGGWSGWRRVSNANSLNKQQPNQEKPICAHLLRQL